MRKSYFYFLISFVLFGVAYTSALSLYQRSNFVLGQRASTLDVSKSIEPSNLSEEELVSVVKPSVVRIIVHVEGDVSIAPFKINLKDFTVRSIPGEKSLKMPVNLDFTGSGFVVNPDGYILTNSHVVSDAIAKMHVVQPIINLLLAGELSSLSAMDTTKMDSSRTKEEAAAFGRQILDYVVEQSTFNLTKKVVVLNPTSKETALKNLTETGFPVEIVSVNEDWGKDDKNVAVLKISEKNLPSLRLGAVSKPSVGSSVYVFNFPSNAELSGNNLLEAAFTQGRVTAFKNSQNTDFRIFQTDAKISTGSNGGPLFDTDGQVAGLLTSGAISQEQSDSDNFALAIPVEIAKEILSDSFIINDEGSYSSHLKAGLTLLHDKRCERAIDEFKLAQSINEKFGVAKYIEPYIEQCNTLIASGSSIDSKWDEFMYKIRSMGKIIWALFAAGIFLLIGVAIGIVILVKHFKKDHAGLRRLEIAIDHQSAHDEEVSPQSPFTTAVRQEDMLKKMLDDRKTMGDTEVVFSSPRDTVQLNHPVDIKQVDAEPSTTAHIESKPPNQALLDYIKQARLAGMTFQSIEKSLKDAGWNDNEISRALAVPE